MAQFETWLKTDLKKPIVVEPLKGCIFTEDNEANLIGVEIFDGGSAASVSGSVTGYIIRQDGATVTVTGTLSSNKAYIVLPSSAYAVSGNVSIVIKVGTVTVGACVGVVYRTTTDTIVDPGHVIPSIAELLEKIADCEAATTAANTAASGADAAASAANAVATQLGSMVGRGRTLQPGSDVTVAITTEGGQKYLDISVPQGAKGDTGATGATGPQGIQGAQGIPGRDGNNGVVVSVSADEYAFYINSNNHLILVYATDAAPNFSIVNGHLIYTIT